MPLLWSSMRDISGYWAFCTRMERKHSSQSSGAASAKKRPRRGTVKSQFLDRRFWLQKNRNTVADRVYSPAFVALQGLFASWHQGFAAHRTGKYFQQFWCDHGCNFSKIKCSVDILKPLGLRRSTIINAQPERSAPWWGQVLHEAEQISDFWLVLTSKSKGEHGTYAAAHNHH
jgi:hypothetical protein